MESDKLRLFEIAPDFVRSQVGVLMTMLQHIEATTPKGTQVPFASVIKLMNNAGYPFSYEDFKRVHDTNPSISNLVSDFNEQSLTLGPAEEEDPEGDLDPNAPDMEQNVANVDAMAKNAMRKAK